MIEATPEGTLLRQALCAALRKGLPLRYKPIWSQIVPEEETNAAASRISTGTEDSTLEDSDASLDSYIPVDTVILLHLINFVRNVSVCIFVWQLQTYYLISSNRTLLTPMLCFLHYIPLVLLNSTCTTPKFCGA